MDSKTETVSDNEVIADWMASKVNVNERGRKEYLLLEAPKGFSGDCWYELGNVRYATSWDWLMPVVRKIESLMPTIKIPEHLEYLKNGTHGSEPYVEVISLPIASPIEEIYKAVVEFIKWYNNSQSPDTIK